MYSRLDICNRALRLVGSDFISSLDQNTKPAEECRFLYPIIKREVIESYPWKCTRKKVKLNSLYASFNDNKNYQYKFLLPFNTVRVLSVDDTNKFERDGIYLYASSSCISLQYTADVDESFMTPRLTKIISLKLALELVFTLLLETDLIKYLSKLIDEEDKRLKQLDSEEGEVIKSELSAISSQSWLTSRI